MSFLGGTLRTFYVAVLNQHIMLAKRRTAESVINTHSVWKVMQLVITFCLTFTLLIGCGGEPNLDNPKVREKILAEAIDYEKLSTRIAPSGEELLYAPNQEQPYTGWVKSNSLDIIDDIRYEFKSIKSITKPNYKGDVELVQYQHGKVHGLYMSWRESSQQNGIKGTVMKGVPDGLWTGWYENGLKGVEGTFRNGLLNGKWTAWHKNGQTAVEVTFLNDKKNGLWTEWYENGQQKEEGTYKNGERDGLWVGWHENSQKAGEVTFLNGKESGLLIMWDENGQEISRETYKDGEEVK